MAEDDDDETFGDFSFAPFPTTPKSIATPNPSSTDEWGEFLSLPPNSNPFDPSSAPDNSTSPPRWTKPHGVLPLSIFGDAEEDEEEEKGNSDVGWGLDQRKSGVNGAGDFNSKLGGKDAPNSQNLNIADLYNRYAQTKPEQGRETDTASVPASADNELRSNQTASGSAASELTTLDLNGKGGVGGQNQLTHNTSRSGDPFGSWNQGFYGVSSNFNTISPSLEMPNADSDTKGQKQLLDGGDDECEFKDAHTEKVNNNEVSNRNTHLCGNVIDSSKSHDVIGASSSNGSLNFVLPPPSESVDYSTSSGFSTISMGLDFFGNQMGAAAPNGWSSDTESNIKDTKANNSTLNHNPGVGSEEFDEDFGEFTVASAEMESKPQEISTNDLFTPFEAVATPPSDGRIQVDFMVPEVSKRYVNSSGSVFGESNGSINFFGTSAEPVDFFANSSTVSSTFKEVDMFGFQSTALNDFISYTNTNTERTEGNDTPNHTPAFDAAETDEDFGELTAAAAETVSKLRVDLIVDGAAERPDLCTSTCERKKSVHVFAMPNNSTNLFGTPAESVDFFAPSNGVSSTSQDVYLSVVQTSTATSNGFMPEKTSTVEQHVVNSTLNHSQDVRDFEFDDDFGEFTAAAAATGPHATENDMKSKHQKGAIPLCICGSDEPENEEPQSGGSSDVQDVFKNLSTSDQRHSHTPAPVFSINDLISSLYSQAKQSSLGNALEKPTKTELSPSNAVSNSNDHLEDDMWDFQDVCQIRVDGEGFPNSIRYTHRNVSCQLKLIDHMDFYRNLKEELCFVVKQHIENLRHDGETASHSGEDKRAASLESEFQLVCKELEQLNLPYEERNSRDYPSGESLKEFAAVLLDPQFQTLESEYHLSDKLLLAVKDEISAMELIRHTTTMLKILITGTLEDRKAYFSVWYEMISTCAQELKHGASIWKQAAAKQVQSQLLSEPEGRKYALGLGEIYRVVAVLGASAKLYKPWMFLDAGDLPNIYALVEECHTVWLSSGLEEAFSSVASPTSLMFLQHILNLDAFELQNHVYAKTKSLCSLSLLTAEVAPGVKMVTWENQVCLATLANLWVNTISRDPPKLPQLKYVPTRC